MTKEAQLQKITEEYLSAFFGFAINRIGNATQAEELSQEIAYQCIVAIRQGNSKDNFDAYIWSIAHNTFKRWCKRKEPLSLDENYDTFSNVISNDVPVVERILKEEEMHQVRYALSRLVGNYRKTIVCFYYDELSIQQISERLSLSEGMVKFYLRAGKQKLKEAFYMNKIGEKSFHPSAFSIYKSALDFSKVNVWDVFKRTLPCQIAIICHDSAKTISDISLETNVPAVYVEEEVQLLLDAGVMISPVKDKYRTNFHILKKNAALQFQTQFAKLYEAYVPSVIAAYEKYLPQMKACDIFTFDATPNQWKWYFAKNVPEFDYAGWALSSDDYPQILSCGSKAVIFAEETEGSPWGAGATPTELEQCTVWPCDVVIFGEYHRQKELWDKRKAQALYDVYCGNCKEEDKELYAELIAQGYVLNGRGKLLCNVAVSTEKSRNLFSAIGAELSVELQSLCGDIRKNIAGIVETTIPPQLQSYVKGYTETWISFYSGVYLLEALYKSGFIAVPEQDDLTPVACYICEK